LERAKFPPPYHICHDGVYATEFLSSIESTPDLWPHLIVMDLKMPRMSGDEALEWLRANPFYHNMPVIILTSSDEVSDYKKTNRLGVLRFLTKEVRCDNLIAALNRFLAVSLL
jgi:CheY-like chemotaxis protein